MTEDVNAEFIIAVGNSDTAKIEQILDTNPELDVNQLVAGDMTALSLASYYGHNDVAMLLLTHPNSADRIDVNCTCNYGRTPFWLFCEHNFLLGIKLLLANPRVDVNWSNDEDSYAPHTPLWHLVYMGRIEAVRWWLGASGRELDLSKLHWRMSLGWSVADLMRHYNHYDSDRMILCDELAKGVAEVVHLLDLYRLTPALAKYQARLALKLPSTVMTAYFALIVFICDSLLVIADTNSSSANQAMNLDNQPTQQQDNYRRFFAMTSKLPIELQMLICHHLAGSDKTIIRSDEAELGFQHLVISYHGSDGDGDGGDVNG